MQQKEAAGDMHDPNKTKESQTKAFADVAMGQKVEKDTAAGVHDSTKTHHAQKAASADDEAFVHDATRQKVTKEKKDTYAHLHHSTKTHHARQAAISEESRIKIAEAKGMVKTSILEHRDLLEKHIRVRSEMLKLKKSDAQKAVQLAGEPASELLRVETLAVARVHRAERWKAGVP